MKYIAQYTLKCRPTLDQAVRRLDGEFYQQPSNRSSGLWLGTFFTDEADPNVVVSEKPTSAWFIPYAALLLQHTGWELDTVPAGYCYYTLQADTSLVAAESYVACSGNFEMLLHGEGTTLIVNSRRHGIPFVLSHPFMKLEPTEVVKYETRCPSAAWYECGLEPEITC